VASPQRIAEIRRHRLLGLKDTTNQAYIDTEKITEEIAFTRRLCGKHQWTILDVTRRSIEETAAAIIKLQEERSGGG
jgi:regulator of PEP synthase PpsR (kinase-PPPase family)